MKVPKTTHQVCQDKLQYQSDNYMNNRYITDQLTDNYGNYEMFPTIAVSYRLYY